MRYRGIEISMVTYARVNSKIMGLIDNIASYFDKSKIDITHPDVELYFSEVCGYLFTTYCFSDKMSNFLMGELAIVNNDVIICYNSNPKIPKVRQNFTKTHEITHSVLHINGYKTQKFLEVTSLGGYPEEQKKYEVEADLGGSIFMINDDALIYHILEDWSAETICYKFEMSLIALKLRVKNFLEYNCQCSNISSELFASHFITNNRQYVKNIVSSCY